VLTQQSLRRVIFTEPSYGDRVTTIKLTHGTHRFFDQLITAQAATVAFIVSVVARQRADIFKGPLGGPISQSCYTTSEEIRFNPLEPLDVISGKQTEVNLVIEPGGTRPSPYPDPTGVQLLMGSLFEHAFITYFAKNEAAIRARHGGKLHWPGALNFGRIVRNAFAHGGTLNITDNIPGQWRGLSYSATANGRRVLYNDLSSGDLTLLMLEMDSAF
jgi:hypothetical protein